MTAIRTDHKVLILSNEAMAAALIGALVERAWLQPAFAEPGESAEQALARVKPILAVLIESSSDVAGSDLFVARARGREIQVALFCRATERARHEAWAQGREIPVFALPAELDRLHGWLVELGDRPQQKRPRLGERRGEPKATRLANGTLVFVDSAGMKWSVYDRRSAQRRAPAEGSTAMERHFVNDLGEDRACDVTEAELMLVSADALGRQLARAHAVM